MICKAFRFPSIICILGSTNAFAADLPSRNAPVEEQLPLAAGWTGPYFGAHAGFGWGTTTFLNNFPTSHFELDARPHISGGLGGLQLGYNYQLNWLVLGLEGAFSWSGIKNGRFPCFQFGDQICTAHPEWLSTITGRVGGAFGPTLVYAKGGVAWANDSFSDVATCAGFQRRSRAGPDCGDQFIANQIRAGWTVGTGIEHQFAQNWSVWAEYNFVNMGARSVSFTNGDTEFFTEKVHQKMHTLTVGLNYRFSGPIAFPLFDPSAPLSSNLFGGRIEDPDAEEETGHVRAFSGIDVSKFSVDGWVGGFIAPFGDLDTSGLRVFLEGSAGAYKYYGDGGAIHGVTQAGSVLVGYAFEGDNYSISLFAGGNVENHTLSTLDPENKVVGTQFGGMIRGEAWYNPTPKTLIYTQDQFSSAFRTWYTEARLGFDVTDGRQIFLGPAIGYLGNERGTQFRIGAHVTQIKFKKLQLDVTAGYAKDSVVGAGAFAKVELSTTF